MRSINLLKIVQFFFFILFAGNVMFAQDLTIRNAHSMVFDSKENRVLLFGGADEKITVTLTEVEGSVSLTIRDRGPGLDAELLGRAMEGFSQIDREKNEQQGAGLGLTIASYYTELNGGHLELNTAEDGVGLAAKLTFPLAG